MASSARGFGVPLGVPLFCGRLQKSASGVGSPKPLSVAAESERRDLARSGSSATGEGTLTAALSMCPIGARPRVRESSLSREGVPDRGSRRSQQGGGESDLDHTDPAQARFIASLAPPRGDGASEASPLTVNARAENACRHGGTSWSKRAERC
jgi:hypothetical protein